MTEAPEAYRTESTARQLGALAASLGRISSSARKESRADAVIPMLRECMAFIEWTAPRVDPEIGAELADIQIMLAIWREGWPDVKGNRSQRSLLSLQAKKWSDRAIDHSGLLAAGD